MRITLGTGENPVLSTACSCMHERSEPELYGFLFLTTAAIFSLRRTFFADSGGCENFYCLKLLFGKRCNKETLNLANAWFLNC